MKTNVTETLSRRRVHGFITRTELFVILGVIVVLGVLLFAATSGPGDRAIRAQCAANLKQFTAGMIALGQQNGGRLPPVSGGLWAWDLPNNLADALQKNNVTRDNMYDPGNPTQNCDDLWNFPYGNRVIGYAMTFPNTASLEPTNQNPSITPQPIRAPGVALPAPDPSQRVLIAGAVMSDAGQGDMSQRNTYRYTEIKGGWNGGTHRSSHLDSAGKIPIGDNLGMLDGSVKWRKFEDMTPRTDPSGTSPVFWW